MPRYTPPDPTRRASKRAGRELRNLAGRARVATCGVCGQDGRVVAETSAGLACDACRADHPGKPTPRLNRAQRRRALHRPRSL